MVSWFWFSWIYCFILFRNIWADLASLPRYSVHHTQVSFDQAAEDCSPGVLTTLATMQEVTHVLQLVTNSMSPQHQNEFTFWVGLRKVKNECVVATPPLRGFKWLEDGSEDSQVSHWLEEPKHTCTTVRCAALKGEFNGSAVTRWGLIPVTCKSMFPFICKRRETGVRPATLDPATPEPPKPATLEPLKPASPEPPKPATPGPSKPATSANLEPRPATQKPEPAKPQPNLPIREPKPEMDLKPDTGPVSDPEPTAGSDSCQRPRIPDARSISLDRDNSSRIQVECWSTDPLELHCSGRPAVWRMLDDSPANFTAVCRLCDAGFQKDASGKCVDVDECSSGAAACRYSCLNTEGSYRCFCSDENGKQHEEDSPACVVTERDGLLVPLLVALAALLVVVVVIVVTVKCCLMRRSKKHAMKAEEMAMKS